MVLKKSFNYFFDKWWPPLLFLLIAVAQLLYCHFTRLFTYINFSFVMVGFALLCLLISIITYLAKSLWLRAGITFVILWVTIQSILIIIFTGSYTNSSTVEFDGENFEYLHPLPMAFGKDTINPELWYRPLNPDGEFARIIRLYSPSDTTIIPLHTAVNDNTSITCYSLLVDNKRCFWLEDNFGTTVYNIDLKQPVKVQKPDKDLTEITETGAPVGIRAEITQTDMKRQLGLKRKSKLIILDSLKFNM